MEDRDRFEARRWDTRVSRGMSLCTTELNCEAAGESEAWLRLMGEADISIGLYGRPAVFAVSRLILMHYDEL
jgi:hypothetical protein